MIFREGWKRRRRGRGEGQLHRLSLSHFVPSSYDSSTSYESKINTHVLIDDDFVLSYPVEVVGSLLVLEEESSNRLRRAERRGRKVEKSASVKP